MMPLSVLEEALQTTDSVYTFTDNHFKQGLIQKSDVLNAQVQVTTVETESGKSKKQYSQCIRLSQFVDGAEAMVLFINVDNIR